VHFLPITPSPPRVAFVKSLPYGFKISNIPFFPILPFVVRNFFKQKYFRY
jgi:hypothetical protein